jgi:(1->4)-alpha-D-glucan 1-alpha-D-glucosylmutase
VNPSIDPLPPSVPRATLRLQFHAGYTLDDAIAQVPYFLALGVSHIYASPLLMARPGSTHGYDIVDHGRINPELGGPEALRRFAEALHRNGLGLILDFAPNHMGIGGADNGWWLDVLEWGRNSPYARFFDIDWNPSVFSMKGKVLVPFLGTHYGAVLQAGDLDLRFDGDEGTFSVWYHEHRFPIAPRHYATLLHAAAQRMPDTSETATSFAARFAALGGGSRRLDRQARISKEAETCKAALGAAVKEQPALGVAIDETLRAFNGTPGIAGSFRDLHRLLERQSYRLAYWRVATDEINYRRFFDINGLAGLRMEDNELFELSHRLIFELIETGIIDGLRLDHVDGLLDPAGYCRRLQDRIAYLLSARAPRSEGAAPGPELDTPFYIVVEKILAPYERLRADWPVNGTTGYDFMAQAGGVFVAPDGERRLKSAYTRFSGNDRGYEETAEQSRRQIIRNNLSSELGVLAGLLHRLAKRHLHTRDFTLNALRLALIDVAAHFPVYRTYIAESGADDEDRRYLDWAMAQARKSPGLLDDTIYDFIHAVLAVEPDRLPGGGWRRRDLLVVARKFQQFTSPVAAKAEEDTAFYRYLPLISLNEVGGAPARYGTSPGAFHHASMERFRRHRHGLLATATHDHKRGEDARARIHVLSEIPSAWARSLARWSRLNRHKREIVTGAYAPSRNDEYLFYQTLVGAWPLSLEVDDEEGLGAFTSRIADYMLKAVREAKLNTSWAAPNEAYEAATVRFVRAALDETRSRGFLADVAAFQHSIAAAGAINGLAQTMLKLTAPGVPDIYQGTEIWDFSLVDPDNRRPVDFEHLAGTLAEVRQKPLPQLLLRWRDGVVKQALIARILAFRDACPALFADGEPAAIEADGMYRDNVLSFSRAVGDMRIAVVVPRLIAGMLEDQTIPLVPASGWADTSLRLGQESAEWENILTGERLFAGDGSASVAAVLKAFPVAVLVQTEQSTLERVVETCPASPGKNGQ